MVMTKRKTKTNALVTKKKVKNIKADTKYKKCRQTTEMTQKR